MQPTRRLKLQSQIQRELSLAIQNGVWDPRLSGMMISSVSLSQDAGLATVFFSLLYAAIEEGEDVAEQDRRLEAAESALQELKPDLRRQLAKAMQTRYIPQLVFRMDRGFENADRVHQLLRTIEQDSSQQEQ